MATLLHRPRAPTRRRLDVDAYYRMAEAGILGPDERVELIDGEIIAMPPIGSEHAGTTDRLNRLAARVMVDGRAVVRVQGPLRLDDWNEPQPDLMLLRPRDDDYRIDHPEPGDVMLLVEVAGSSLAYDRGVKLPLYARFGVPEVWIVDLAGRAVELYREPGEGGWGWHRRLAEGRVAPALLPELEIDLAALLA